MARDWRRAPHGVYISHPWKIERIEDGTAPSVKAWEVYVWIDGAWRFKTWRTTLRSAKETIAQIEANVE